MKRNNSQSEFSSKNMKWDEEIVIDSKGTFHRRFQAINLEDKSGHDTNKVNEQGIVGHKV